ncbi:nucleotide exchange factor GrpE [Streptomyces syringium]|uniref:Nucleotide exchange factor GrpE n=1 Tax=Streptomyces syringium TaxID=76729 RepID=A0ABS4XX44_9ACTN|nr:nucleotide exchange factor GrpE [Streptomyces syringium]MBP2401087.1 hypothetical protein [Streptomyces syringium]
MTHEQRTGPVRPPTPPHPDRPPTAAHDSLAELSARCAAWLGAERDRIEGELRAAYGKPPGTAVKEQHPAPDSVPPAAVPLIELLDRLAGLAGDPPAADGPVLDRVRRGVVAALTASGVTPVEDTGPVDPARHHVVATRDDPSGLLSDRIAETVRPGYLWRDVLLRPQEVVSYVPYVGPRPPRAEAERGRRDAR